MTKTSSLLRLTLIFGVALGASGCETLASLDPTGLLSDDAAPAPAGQFPDAAAAPPASDTSAGTTPDLASLPDRPTATSQAQQQQTAQSLAADGAQAQYSADVLRGGTEAAAPPPGAASPAIAPTTASAAPPRAAPDNDAPPTTDAAPTAQAANVAPPKAAPPSAVPVPSAPAGAQAAVAGPGVPAGPVAAPSASPPPSPGGEPAVPANTPVRMAALSGGQSPSDAALGFQPSAAPPLDPSISQWVAAPIVDHYRQTAANAGLSATSGGAAVPLVGASAAMGGTPTAIVYFPGDGFSLSAAARGQIRSAVTAFKASGGTGTIRVVGHASSRTANMSVEKHMETIFDKSQKRANAVAQELIHEGIPAAKVLVEAVGDSQPVYYESMPKGEDGNRRTEIFVQS